MAVILGNGDYARRVVAEVAERDRVRVIDLVKLLEWAYSVERVNHECPVKDDRSFLEVKSGYGSVATVCELGTFIDGGGVSKNDPHKDAQAVHEAVLEFAGYSDDCAYAAGLVIYFATTKTQPEAPVRLPKVLRPARNSRGGLKMSYGDSQLSRSSVRTEKRLPKVDGIAGRGRVGQACDLVLHDPNLETDRQLREQYAIWCVALETIFPLIPVLKKFILQQYQSPKYDPPRFMENFSNPSA